MPVPSRSQSYNIPLKCSEDDDDTVEFALLGEAVMPHECADVDHERRTAPIMTHSALVAAKLNGLDSQYGLLGSVLSVSDSKGQSVGIKQDPRLYVNTNAPFSALVCGVQGSGKSHTVSAMLESMLISGDRRIGVLSKPLCGLVLHLGEGGQDSNPSESAWIGLADKLASMTIGSKYTSKTVAPRIKVLVSPSSVTTMRKVYSCFGDNISVEPLYFLQGELDAEAFLSMMAIDTSDHAPLYMQAVLSILRGLGESYTYDKFKAELMSTKKDFNPAQLSSLKQRMALLEAFIRPQGKGTKRFAAGQLTIVDLSDPFIDPASACGIFQTVTRLFIRAKVDTGKVLVVDEAHKYLKTSDTAMGLTKTLITLIREQRHKALRVIISTQEPTVVPPVLIDLCSIIMLHRFSSPAWWGHVKNHVSADLSSDAAFDNVSQLKTGEAILVSPSGLCILESPEDSTKKPIVSQLGRRFMHMRTRKRVTKDGGASIMVL